MPTPDNPGTAPPFPHWYMSTAIVNLSWKGKALALLAGFRLKCRP
jgi:hypothetical protein